MTYDWSAHEPRSQRFPGWLLLLGGFLGSCIHFWHQGDPLAVAGIAILGATGLFGYWIGSGRLLCFVLGITAASVLAPRVARLPAEYLERSAAVPATIAEGIAMGTASLALVLLVSYLARRTGRILARSLPWLHTVNRWSGGAIGIAQGAMLVLAITGCILATEPMIRSQYERDSHQATPTQRFLARCLLDVAENTRQSAIGPIIARFNPFQHGFPQLREYITRLHSEHEPAAMPAPDTSAVPLLSVRRENFPAVFQRMANFMHVV